VVVPIYDRAIGFKITADLIKKHLSDKTRLISIIDPLNPLGTAYTEEEIKQFCRLAEENGAYLLHDATYREFAGDEHYPAPRYYDKAVSAVSLSKCSGFSGLRFGALLTHPDLFEKIVENQISRLGASWVTQRGAAAAYASKKEWLPELLEVNLAHQRLLHEAIDNVQGMDAIAFPSKGNFLAIDVTNTKIEADEIVKKVLDAGIVIRSGGYTSKLFGNRFIRITTTVPREHVLRACDVLSKVL
jgi:aspartate/methionine/tyrosine aminotransferase